jgi:CHAT domain-containing protein
VRPDTVLLRRVPDRGRLAKLVRPLIDALRMPPRIGAYDETGLRALAEAVLPSPAWFEETSGGIFIVPDGPLCYVPFETLPVAMDSAGSALMIERGPVSYAPSAAVLLSVWNRGPSPAGGTVLAVGIRDAHGLEPVGEGNHIGGAPMLPPLRYAEAEAESVCASFPPGCCTSVIGLDATEGRVVHELQEPYAIAHLATHAMINLEAPRSSCIVLNPGPASGDDGVLVFDEILQLSSSPRLVVLSSCQSALGQLISGEGIVSLSRAFFHAGARTVLVTLWPVNDRSAVSWMSEFYQCLAEGASPDQAARAAKLRLLHGHAPATRHPYYWAPFVLIGGS